MKVVKAELMAAAYSLKDFPTGTLPEVSLIGRSNVGKSSLINTLLLRKNLARTSSTPGKTRGLYFYEINDRLCLVDLPGYGYAKVSKEERRRWAPVIEDYLANRGNLRGCLQLLDVRHEPTEDDLLMAQWLRAHTIPVLSVATKADKLSRGALSRQLKIIREKLGLFEDDRLLAFSSRTGSGRAELWQAISTLLKTDER